MLQQLKMLLNYLAIISIYLNIFLNVRYRWAFIFTVSIIFHSFFYSDTCFQWADLETHYQDKICTKVIKLGLAGICRL